VKKGRRRTTTETVRVPIAKLQFSLTSYAAWAREGEGFQITDRGKLVARLESVTLPGDEPLLDLIAERLAGAPRKKLSVEFFPSKQTSHDHAGFSRRALPDEHGED
jgi:hypothetical protein